MLTAEPQFIEIPWPWWTSFSSIWRASIL